MMNLFKSCNLYKLIVFIFLIVAIVKIKNQLVMLNSYNLEIATLNEKIFALEEQESKTDIQASNSRKDNEEIARKDLKMYYPNETPYKGY